MKSSTTFFLGIIQVEIADSHLAGILEVPIFEHFDKAIVRGNTFQIESHQRTNLNDKNISIQWKILTHHSLWKMNFQCSIREPTTSEVATPSASDLSFHWNK